MSNYPPGVTGFERQISGADAETTREIFCDVCEFDGTGYAEITGQVVTVWCPECENEMEWTVYDEHDY